MDTTVPGNSGDTVEAEVGDPESWVDRYGESLFRYASAKLRDPTVAEEVVQDTFLAALQGRDRFRRDSSLATWLFSILRRKVADRYRAQRPDTPGLGSPDDMASRGTPQVHSDWGADPAILFENQEFWQTFEACVDRLPDKLAEAHIMREINGYAPKEICKILGIAATTLSMRLHRSRVALRECLKLHWFHSDG